MVFQKVIEITMPPQQCLPFTDRLCYDSVLNSLSVKNILKVVAALLQEHRVLFVSSQMDTLTLCAAAFVSFLYPFKWMHPLVPLLPTALIEYLEAPTPYLMGVQTHVYESDDCQAVIDGRRRRPARLRQGDRAPQRPRGDLPQELPPQDAEGLPGTHPPTRQ